jgi:hypothetical protein
MEDQPLDEAAGVFGAEDLFRVGLGLRHCHDYRMLSGIRRL